MDAIYLRISQDREGQELGIERQRKDCKALAKKGAREYVDNDISATSGRRRPQYEALLEAVERGEVKRVIVWSDTRLYRSRRDRYRCAELFRDKGVVVVAVKGGTLDFRTAAGRLVADVLGSVATHETEQMAERLQAWALQRAESGKTHGGRRLYGYSPDGMKKVPAEARQVKDWFRRHLAGESVMSLARSAGCTTDAMRLRLSNPRYAGLRVFNGVEYAGTWPAIVSVEQWRASVLLLEGRRKGGRPPHTLLSGLAVCVACDRPVSSHVGRRGPTYRCLTRTGGCGRQWKREWVDQFVEDLVAGRLAGDLRNLLPKERPDMAALDDEARTIRAGLKVLAGDVFKGIDVADEVKRQKARLAEIEAAQARHDEVMGDLMGAADPLKRYLSMTVERRSAVIRRMMGIRLLDPPRGRPKGRTERERRAWYLRECVDVDRK